VPDLRRNNTLATRMQETMDQEAAFDTVPISHLLFPFVLSSDGQKCGTFG